MFGLIAGIGAGVGALTGGLSSWYEADQKRKAEKAHNKRVNEQLANIKKQRDLSNKRESMTASDFMTQYAMVRDPQKSQGIQQMYQQNRQLGNRERAQLDAFGNELEASQVGVTSNADVSKAGWLGAMGGAASGAAFGQGLEGSMGAKPNTDFKGFGEDNSPFVASLDVNRFEPQDIFSPTIGMF